MCDGTVSWLENHIHLSITREKKKKFKEANQLLVEHGKKQGKDNEPLDLMSLIDLLEYFHGHRLTIQLAMHLSIYTKMIYSLRGYLLQYSVLRVWTARWYQSMLVASRNQTILYPISAGWEYNHGHYRIRATKGNIC